MMTPTIDQTIELIQALHVGQTDWTGAPYWQHPVAVMRILPTNSPVDRRIVALLHDVAEDCQEKVASILGMERDAVDSAMVLRYLSGLGYSVHVVEGVRLLTRTKGVAYLDEIQAIAASNHLDAIWVKLCDNTHNTSEERIAVLPPVKAMQVRALGVRYEKSKAILKDALIKIFSGAFRYTDKRGISTNCWLTPSEIEYRKAFGEPSQWLLTGKYPASGVAMTYSMNAIEAI